MTHDEMIDRLQAECDTLVATVRNKNSSYGNDSAGPFHNFNIIEFLTDGHITAEVGILVRCTDKLARAYNLMAGQSDQVGEPLADTLRDLAAYSLLALIAHEAHDDVVISERGRGCTLVGIDRCPAHGEPAPDGAGTQAPDRGCVGQNQSLLNDKQQSAWARLVEALKS